MAIVQPIKLVYDANNNPIALSEFQAGDTISKQYLMSGVDIDGGAISDIYTAADNVDGGVISDVFGADDVSYDGGTITQ